MRLITELQEDVQVITEEVGGKKKYFIEGISLQANIRNKNNRIYPSQIMENEVNRYIKEKVEQNRAYGELGHPTGPQINLERVSHIFKSLRRDGQNWIGRSQVVEEGCGKIVIGLLEAGAKLGTSSRALGSLANKNGIMEVQNDFRLSTAGDIVSDPSGPDCFVQGLMEGVEWVWNNGILVEQHLTQTKREINSAVRTQDQRKINEAFLAAWEKFLGKL